MPESLAFAVSHQNRTDVADIPFGQLLCIKTTFRSQNLDSLPEDIGLALNFSVFSFQFALTASGCGLAFALFSMGSVKVLHLAVLMMHGWCWTAYAWNDPILRLICPLFRTPDVCITASLVVIRSKSELLLRYVFREMAAHNISLFIDLNGF